MKTQTEEADFHPFDYVYTGRCTLKGGKTGGQLGRLIDGRIEDTFVFEARNFKGKAIGGIYRGATFGDQSARGLEGAKYVGRWSDESACIDWRARDDALEAKMRLAKLEADAKRMNDIEVILLPLRKLYASYARRYDHAGKEALEQAVLRALRSLPRKSEAE